MSFKFWFVNLSRFSFILKYFRSKENFLSTFFYWFSLLMLVMRTGCMAVSAANVHDEMKKPIEVLRRVPCDRWDAEVSRI